METKRINPKQALQRSTRRDLSIDTKGLVSYHEDSTHSRPSKVDSSADRASEIECVLRFRRKFKTHLFSKHIHSGAWSIATTKKDGYRFEFYDGEPNKKMDIKCACRVLCSTIKDVDRIFLTHIMSRLSGGVQVGKTHASRACCGVKIV